MGREGIKKNSSFHSFILFLFFCSFFCSLVLSWNTLSGMESPEYARVPLSAHVCAYLSCTCAAAAACPRVSVFVHLCARHPVPFAACPQGSPCLWIFVSRGIPMSPRVPRPSVAACAFPPRRQAALPGAFPPGTRDLGAIVQRHLAAVRRPSKSSASSGAFPRGRLKN